MVDGYQMCPLHPGSRFKRPYWRGCPRCHPVVMLEDMRDRLMSDVCSAKQILNELLHHQIREMGSNEPLRLVSRGGTRHNIGPVNGEDTPPPVSLWEDDATTDPTPPSPQPPEQT